MVYLARKITRAKQESRESFAEGEIPVDAVTVDLSTRRATCFCSGNVELPPDDGIHAVALATVAVQSPLLG